jgi:endo-1,4-beta-D-glucanase Y
MKDPSAYSFNTAGARFPFPQGHKLGACSYPVYDTDTVAQLYTNWKSKFFQGGRVVRPENANDTVSEGIGYGMLIGVYMNDRPLVDTLWSYAQSKFNGNGLMNWQIGSGGNVIGQGSATDGDEDMAWALLQASAQWGGTYKADALKLIESIWNKEVDQGGGNVLKPGDNFGGAGQTNPSYFAPAYYRAFAKVNTHDWMALVDSSYAILEKASGAYGLVPNWVNASGAGMSGPNNDVTGPFYGFDASRTPWRIAQDFCQNNEPRAKAYLQKVVAFFAMQAPTSLGALKDAYTATGGKPTLSAPNDKYGSYAAGMAMFGPAGTATLVGGQDAFQKLVVQALDSNSTELDKMSINGVYTYYHASWGVLSMLALSGSFWDMQ